MGFASRCYLSFPDGTVIELRVWISELLMRPMSAVRSGRRRVHLQRPLCAKSGHTDGSYGVKQTLDL